MSLEDFFFFHFNNSVVSPFLNPFLNFWVPDKASIMWKKNNVTRLINNHDFFTKWFLKWPKQLHVKGLAGVCIGSGTKSSSLSSLYFQSCSRQIASPAQKYGCFAVNWFRKIWKFKNNLICRLDWNQWLPKDHHPSQLSYTERLMTTHT